jgi:hypothetical protein
MAPGESSEQSRSFEAVGADVAADHDLADMSRTRS